MAPNLSTGNSSTPLTNRGLDSQTISLTEGIDWLTCTRRLDETFTTEAVEPFIAELCKSFDTEYSIEHDGYFKIGRPYENRARSACGIQVLWSNPKGMNEKGFILVSIPGSPLSQLTVMNQFWLIKGLADKGFGCTRIDLRLDDYNKTLSPEFFEQVADNGWVKNDPEVRNPSARNRSGFTWYVGNRNSDKLLRHYDKDIESKGTYQCYRTELEAKSDYANEIFSQLGSIGRKILQKNMTERLFETAYTGQIASIILGAFTFVIPKEGDKNLSRGTVPEAWQAFIDYVNRTPFKIIVQKVIPTIEKSIAWFKRSCGKVLAKAEAVLTENDFIELIATTHNDGKDRFNSHDHAQIRQHLKPTLSLFPDMPVIPAT
jgi:hypothetical protein